MGSAGPGGRWWRAGEQRWAPGGSSIVCHVFSFGAVSAHPLAKSKIEVDLAGLATAKAAWLYDNGHPAAEASNVAKYAAAEAAVSAVDHVIQIHGGNGLSAEYGLLPQWGLARLLRIAPVSREMILNYVAQHSLELPRSY